MANGDSKWITSPQARKDVQTFRAQASAIDCIVTCETKGQTGVEMEALTGVQVTLLTIYDMCKAVDRGMVIDAVRLLEKSGGKSGHWKRD